MTNKLYFGSKEYEGINKAQLNEEQKLVFTADYGLYRWDYKGVMILCLLN